MLLVAPPTYLALAPALPPCLGPPALLEPDPSPQPSLAFSTTCSVTPFTSLAAALPILSSGSPSALCPPYAALCPPYARLMPAPCPQPPLVSPRPWQPQRPPGAPLPVTLRPYSPPISPHVDQQPRLYIAPPHPPPGVYMRAAHAGLAFSLLPTLCGFPCCPPSAVFHAAHPLRFSMLRSPPACTNTFLFAPSAHFAPAPSHRPRPSLCPWLAPGPFDPPPPRQRSAAPLARGLHRAARGPSRVER